MTDNAQVLTYRPLPGARLDMAHPLTKGLVGCWLLNEGGYRAMDLSPYGNHGTLVGFASPVRRPFNGLTFDGAATYVNLGSNSRIRNFTAMSCIIWLKTKLKAGVSYQHIIDSGRWASTYGYVLNQDDAAQSINPFLRNSAGTSANLTVVPFVDNVWLQTGWTWNGTTGYSIQNGRLLAGIAATGSIISSCNPILSGRADAVTLNHWAGIIAAFMLWNRALAPLEVKQNYQNPYGMILR